VWYVTATLTCVRGCVSRGRHLDNCADESCWGCLPRLAATGLQVCGGCERKVREWTVELPLLYVDLLRPTRTTASLNERVDAEISRPALISDRCRLERDSIRACLVTWMMILIEEREMSAPEDTIRAMADRLRVHAGWLLSSWEHADQLVHDLEASVITARRAAYPSRPDSHPLGKCPVELDDGVLCGEIVRARPSDEYATCRKCGTEAVIEWWQRVIHAAADDAEAVTAAEAASMLSWMYKKIVTEAAIRQWAVRSQREREKKQSDGRDVSALPVVTRAGRDDRGRMLYVRADLLGYAAKMLAKKSA
jgi:hypothetical protein